MKKLTKEQIESKKKFHENRTKFYSKKLKEENKKDKRIGFKHYD